MTKKTSDFNPNNQISNNEDLEIRPIIEKVLRNKIFIITFAFACSFISAVVAINTQKVWQGEFQIVYDKETQKSGGTSLGGLDLSVFKIGMGTRLKTQVSILKSPYVLMDIYEYVRKERKDNMLTFKKWVRSLDVSIVDSTNVLNIVYQDTNKIILKKVLEDMAESYEIYRKDKRRKDIATGMNFLEKQIEKYEVKANNDYAKLQEYAQQQSIYLPTVLPISRAAPMVDQFVSDKINSFNKLKEIELNIKQLKKLPIDSDEIFSKSIALVKERQETIPEYETYLANEITLSNLRKIFKEEDIEIQSLLFQKNNLREIIRKKLLNKLMSEKNLYLSKIDSLNRSQDKLNTFGNLLRKAMKSNTTLNSMEQNYIQLTLEKTNDLNESQIITNPTILPYAVAPQKKQIVIITFLVTSVIASFVSYIYEKNRNFLSSKSELIPFAKNKSIDHLYINKLEEWEDIVRVLIKSTSLDTNAKTAIYQMGSREDSELSTINKVFENVLGNKKFIITSKINDLLEYKNIICLIYLGSIKIPEFQKQNSRLQSIPDLNISYLTIE